MSKPPTPQQILLSKPRLPWWVEVPWDQADVDADLERLQKAFEAHGMPENAANFIHKYRDRRDDSVAFQSRLTRQYTYLLPNGGFLK